MELIHHGQGRAHTSHSTVTETKPVFLRAQLCLPPLFSSSLLLLLLLHSVCGKKRPGEQGEMEGCDERVPSLNLMPLWELRWESDHELLSLSLSPLSGSGSLTHATQMSRIESSLFRFIFEWTTLWTTLWTQAPGWIGSLQRTRLECLIKSTYLCSSYLCLTYWSIIVKQQTSKQTNKRKQSSKNRLCLVTRASERIDSWERFKFWFEWSMGLFFFIELKLNSFFITMTLLFFIKLWM